MRITEGFVPQPVSPTMRVTRFSKIFSTILSLRAITGRDAKFDCGNGAEREELHDVGDDGDSPIFKTLARSLAQYCIAIPLSARTRREGKENGKKQRHLLIPQVKEGGGSLSSFEILAVEPLTFESLTLFRRLVLTDGREKCACKISRSKLRTEIDVEDARREVEIMRHLPKHPNIASFKEAYEDRDAVHLVVELCKGDVEAHSKRIMIMISKSMAAKQA
ncbi:hypothetical protein NC651_036390 [Populus alba x Populus x berolinensis]|nr:hypothetical protein NC651_036390 [Populus alba x Populus x berolinensis]